MSQQSAVTAVDVMTALEARTLWKHGLSGVPKRRDAR